MFLGLKFHVFAFTLPRSSFKLLVQYLRSCFRASSFLSRRASIYIQYIYQGEESRTGKDERDSQSRTGGQNKKIEYTEQDRWTEQAELDRQNRSGSTGHAEQESRNVTGRTVRTGQAERDKQKQDRQTVESRTGQKEEDK